MTLELKGHKIVERLNPNNCNHLRDLTDCLVPPRHILSSIRNRNDQTTTTIKHIYNACYRYMHSIKVQDQKYIIS